MRGKQARITHIQRRKHNILIIKTERPEGFVFVPGQAAKVYINRPGWETRGLSLAIASLPQDDFLEFIVKTNPLKDAVIRLLNLKLGDRLILTEAFGNLNYKGEGTFIAGGVGIAPFLSILRSLKHRHKLGKNKLIYANRTAEDILFEEELQDLLGQGFINILSDEVTKKYAHGFISEPFLRGHGVSGDEYIYLCGPPPMVHTVESHLSRLEIDEKQIVK